MPKESANGRVARWLAGDERVAVLTSERGRKWRMGKYFQPLPPFIGEEERESLGGPHESATDAGVEPDWRTPWHASVSPVSGD
jgi:hypothetical protein